MPIPFDDSVARVQSALTSFSAGNELIAAIQNASALSADTANRLAIACTSDVIARNIQNAILGIQPLSQNDLADLKEVLTSETVGLNYAQLVAGGITDKYGSVSYPSSPTAVAVIPSFSVPAGSYGPTQSVALSSSTPGASIYYTVDGSTPTTSSTLYSSAISVSSSETVKAIAVKSGFVNSSVASAAYVINGQVATPTFSPVAGSYSGTQTVTISSATSGATFFYTVNGSTPTRSSTPYAGPISVAASETVKVLAIKTNFVDSAIASAAYVIS